MYEELKQVGTHARQVSRQLRTLGTDVKNEALLAIAEAILERRADILSANEKDIEQGRAAVGAPGYGAQRTEVTLVVVAPAETGGMYAVVTVNTEGGLPGVEPV